MLLYGITPQYRNKYLTVFTKVFKFQHLARGTVQYVYGIRDIMAMHFTVCCLLCTGTYCACITVDCMSLVVASLRPERLMIMNNEIDLWTPFADDCLQRMKENKGKIYVSQRGANHSSKIVFLSESTIQCNIISISSKSVQYKISVKTKQGSDCKL